MLPRVSLVYSLQKVHYYSCERGEGEAYRDTRRKYREQGCCRCATTSRQDVFSHRTHTDTGNQADVARLPGRPTTNCTTLPRLPRLTPNTHPAYAHTPVQALRSECNGRLVGMEFDKQLMDRVAIWIAFTVYHPRDKLKFISPGCVCCAPLTTTM